MNLKYLIIVSLILAILTIGAVSASEDISDNNLTADSQDSIIESADNENELSTDDAEDIVSDETETDLIEDYSWEVYIQDEFLETDGKSVYVHLPKKATGTVTYNIDDEYSETIDVYSDGYDYSESHYYFGDIELTNGKHNIIVTYNGDETYKGFTFEKTFTIAPVAINFPDIIQIGSSYDDTYEHILEVTEDIQGNITIWIDDEIFLIGNFSQVVQIDYDEVFEYYIPINLDDYSFGQHTYKITYDLGESERTKIGSFNITYYMNINPINYQYGQNASITVTLPYDANNNITVIANGRTFTYQSNGRTTHIPINDLVYGENTVKVTYSDEKYPVQSITTTFNRISSISEIGTIVYGSGEGFSLELPSDATGHLSVYEASYNYIIDEYDIGEFIENVTINGGKAFCDVSRWNLGYHYIKVIYENGNYEINEDDVIWFRIVPIIKYNSSVIVGEDAEFTVTLPENATGNLTVKVYEFDSEDYYDDSEPIATYENKCNISLNTETPGFYTIILTYSQDEDNIHVKDSHLFRVFEQGMNSWDFNVYIPTHLFYYEEVEVDFNHPKCGDGIFILYIDGKEVSSCKFGRYYEDFYLSFDSDEFKAGTHEWEVKYVNDSFYASKTQSGTFEIGWAFVPEIVEIGSDSQYITIKIPEINKGTVELYLDGGKTDEIELTYGQAQYMLENLIQNHVYNYELRYIEGNLTKTGTFNVSYAIQAYVDDAVEDYDWIYYRQYNNLTVILPEDATGAVEIIGENGTYEGIVENGVAIIPVNLHWGKNTLTIKYSGDDVYDAKTINKTFTVSDAEITGEMSDGKLTSISVYLPDDALGELILYVDWREFTKVQVENGKATINLDYDALPLGCYRIMGEYSSHSYNYYAEQYSKFISVEPEMIIPEEIGEGEDCNIIIYLPNATSNMEVYVDGESKGTFQTEDGIFNITLTDLALGNHTITFRYDGGEYNNLLRYYDEYEYEYHPIEYSVNVVERDYEAKLNINVENIDLGDNVTIYLTINDKATGIVKVNVAEYSQITGLGNELYNQTFDVTINNGKGNFTISGLENAKYDVVATYEGNGIIESGQATGSFNVLDDANLTVEFNDIQVGENFIANISMKSKGFDFPTPTVEITPSMGCYPVFLNNGKGKINITISDAGKYTIKVKFDGNDYFKAAEFIATFKVTPAYEDPELNASTNDIDEGQNATVTVNIKDNADGQIYVTINGTTKTQSAQGLIIKKGEYNFTFENLPVGTHTVIVNYTGTPLSTPNNGSLIYYKPVVKTITIEVKPVPVSPNLEADATDIYTGQNATINVSINENITGNVTIQINNENKTITINNGKGTFTIPDLTAGSYEFEIKFHGDKYFLAENKNVTFNVKAKEDAGLTVTLSDSEISVGEKIIVSITIASDITGSVTINDDVIEIVDGKGNYTISDLTANNYTYTVNFAGDVKYNPDNKEVNFKVTFKNADLTLETADVFIGENVTVNITINENATGRVIINNENVNIVEGKGQYIFTNLTIGNYMYNVTFTGDEKFAADSQTLTFNVKAFNARIEVINDINEYKNGNFTFRVINADTNSPMNNVSLSLIMIGNIRAGYTAFSDEEGIVSFKTSNLYCLELNDTLTIYPLKIGKHLVELSINDKKINSTKLQINLTITPAHLKISIGDYEEYYGSDNNLTFTVTNVNGEIIKDEVFKVSIPNINPKPFYVSTNENGTSVISLKKITKGTYEITITNNDTENIVNITAKSNATIKPLDSEFTVNAENVSFGENATVVITLNKEFEGIATINVDGEDKRIDIRDGEGKFVLNNLNAGNYTFKVFYGGDLRFTQGNETVSFKVNKISPNLSVSEIGEIKQGNDVIIHISADKLFSAEVKVQVGTINTTAIVKNGKGNVTVSTLDLELGETIVKLISDENINFQADDATGKFNITAKSDAGTNVIIPDTVTSDGFDVILSEDATGGVYVTIDGNTTYIPLVNGSAKVDVSNLPAGKHDITINYPGDKKYGPFVKTSTVTVPSAAVPVKIIAKDLSVQYLDGTKYTVTVYGTDGKLAVGAQVVFKINGKKVGTAKTNDKGIATLKINQVPKTYKITAEALGANVTKKLTVKQILTLKKVKVKKSAKKLVLKATLKKVKGKYLKGKKITFKFNGKKYKAKTNKKGVAKVTIKKNVLKKLKVGKKVKYTATYSKTTVTKTVKINK